MSEMVEEADAEMGEEEEEEEEEISDADKLAIVQHLMLNSPPGELDEVKNDALNLVGDDLVSPAMLAGICRAYNLQNLRTIELSETEKLVLCAAAEIDPTKYLDPRTGSSYMVDHVNLTAEKIEDENEVSTGTELRKEVEDKLNSYISGRYSNNHGASAVFDSSSDDVVLSIVVAGENVNLRNYWSGNWRSSWQLLSDNSLQGEMKVRAHYFEDGNVQLQTTKKFAPVILTDSDLATAIVNHIQESESTLQQGLEDMYANMSHETFKAMRRVMPITRTKMKWNINEIALNRNLRK